MEEFQEFTKIIDLRDGMKKQVVRAIILDIDPIQTRTLDNCFLLKIADETAKIDCTIFDRRAYLLKSGDIIHMTDCVTRCFRGRLTLYMYETFRETSLVRIGEFCLAYNDEIDMSKHVYYRENYKENKAFKISPFKNKSMQIRKKFLKKR